MKSLRSFEFYAVLGSFAIIGVAIFLLQVSLSDVFTTEGATPATAAVALSVVDDSYEPSVELEVPIKQQTMKINEIKLGAGMEAQNGNTVSVHYVGRLEDGSEFDNSQKRGAPIEFVLGAGQVIAGWEEGILGMKVGGERTLVIPPDKAYGEAGIGPIPPNATLTFTVELVAVN